MSDRFFDRPILNSPYEYPSRHWELDETGQPTSRILDRRRHVSFITPIPKPKKRGQREMDFDEAAQALETDGQQYQLMEIINALRRQVDAWRAIPDPARWRVTPETAGSSATGAATERAREASGTASATYGPSSARSKRRRPQSG